MLEIPDLPENGGQSSKVKSVAVLTSGGDAPGMNAAVRAVVRYGIFAGLKVFGVKRGYTGLIKGEIEPMNLSSVANIIQQGGTVLKTARCPEFHKKEFRAESARLLRAKGIDALVVIGGDGSFTGAHLFENETGFPTIGVPGTIDNDIAGTSDTIGFDTAVNTAIEAIDRIRDTASSHDRLFLVEVMGRSSGHIATQVGIGGGAETVIVPEEQQSLDDICSVIDRGVKRGKSSSIVVVAEGPKPGLSTDLAHALEKRGYGSKVCILGHIQRGGRPSSHDRFLASTLGAAAVAHLLLGASNAMVGTADDRVVLVPFSQVMGKKKPHERGPMRLAEILAR